MLSLGRDPAISGSHQQDAAVLELAEWQLNEVKMAKELGNHGATLGDPESKMINGPKS